MSKYDVSRFRNVTVALNTPFTKSGEVDLAAARRLTRYYINKGIKSLYVCGSTGEVSAGQPGKNGCSGSG